MQLHRAQATFGKLQNQTLELHRGLNIIHAPNETGKSTWCAFLLAMFYGINSKERDKAGYIAEKNRYQPWNGSAMSGRLELQDRQQEITLTRTTKRTSAPMGEFQAVYTGTATPVTDLNSLNCGETLLGVSREVYERSCFIRQSGLSITQDTELERRIAALITTGEEDTSFTEAYDALKKQLNRRQHNKTGQIPALEAELQELNRQLNDAANLQAELLRLRAESERLASQKAQLDSELEQHRLWDLSLQQKQRDIAFSAAQRTQEQAQILERQLTAAQIPDAATITRMQSTLDSLCSLRTTVGVAEDALRRAKAQLSESEQALAASPYAGKSEEQVRNATPNLPVRPKYKVPLMIAAGLLGTGASTFLLPGQNLALSLGFGIGCVVLSALLQWLTLRRKIADWESQLARLRQKQNEDADAYHLLLEQQRAAQADVVSKQETVAALTQSFANSEANLLSQVRRFAPAVFDSASAAEALQYAAQRRKTCFEAAEAAQRAQMRYEVLSQQASDTPIPEVQQPSRSKDAISFELNAVTGQLGSVTSSMDRISGQLHMIGDSAALTAEVAQKEEALAALRADYNAVKLAMDSLESANTTLQNRFSPELGKRTTEIFHCLSGNRYHSVTMDRSFRLSVKPEEDPVDRSIQLLSAGAADQLYLATRLAICDLVLPKDQNAPIILDDALANFDDERCISALRYLKEAATNRQIILFSCHSREADYFAGDEQVSVQRLTNVDERV